MIGTLLNTKCTERVKHRHFVSVMQLYPWMVMVMVTMDNGGDDYVDGDGDAIAPLVGDVEGMQGPTR